MPQQWVIAGLSENPTSLLESLGLGKVKSTYKTDDLKLTAENGDVVHLKLSSNSPELRCYVESNALKNLELLLKSVSKNIKEM